MNVFFSSAEERLKNFKTKVENIETELNIISQSLSGKGQENSSINDYMLHIQREVGLNPRCLSQKEIVKLRNMEEEKYRRSLV